MSRQYFEVGTTYAGRVNVEAMTTVPNLAPLSIHQSYSETAPTLDGGEYARGFPVILWKWGFVPKALFDALRVICPAGSIAVIIRSRPEASAETTSSDYAYYSAIMHWPALDSYEWKAKDYRPFELRFTNVAIYTP